MEPLNLFLFKVIYLILSSPHVFTLDVGNSLTDKKSNFGNLYTEFNHFSTAAKALVPKSNAQKPLLAMSSAFFLGN